MNFSRKSEFPRLGAALAAMLLVSLLPLRPAAAGDLCEFSSLEQAKAAGWAARSGAAMEISSDSKVGSASVKVAGQKGMKPYGGIELTTQIDVSQAAAGDQISFYIKQNFTSGMWININGGALYRSFKTERGKWTHVTLDMDPAQWQGKKEGKKWPVVKNIAIYQKSFDKAGQELLIDGLQFTVGGKQAAPSTAAAAGAKPDDALPEGPLPRQTDRAWFLGNDAAAWAISSGTGQVLGGWNARTKEQYVRWDAARYYVQDSKSTHEAKEEADKITAKQFDAGKQELHLSCVNPAMEGVKIEKSYRIEGGRLIKKTVLTDSQSGKRFITLNSEVSLVPAYRDDGYYMGAGYVGPLVPAPKLSAPEKVTIYRSTSKGMVLSRADKGYSFAHYRYLSDGNFVWPWWSKWGEPENILTYTPTGWEMSLGTHKLSSDSTSWEEHFDIFPGTWFDFLAREYPSLPEVRKELAQIPTVPGWLANVKVEAKFDGLADVERAVQMYDHGDILVLLSRMMLDWADYDVRQGQSALDGGHITGPELQSLVKRIQAISPRVKVGVYNWDLSTGYQTKILKDHPEWFRTHDKQGNAVNLFPGMMANYAAMIDIPALYDALQEQFKIELSYLGEKFMYLDGAKTSNLIDWATGHLTRDDQWQRFWLDMNRQAKAHDPQTMLFFNGRGNPYGDMNYIEARSELRAGFWRQFAGTALGIETFLNCRPGARVSPLYWTKAFARDYVNRVLALGWTARPENGVELSGRPFVTASYEIGDTSPIDALYSPDWKRDPQTQLESYFVQRTLGPERQLSLISHEKQARTFHIEIDTDSLGIAKEGNVYVWGYAIADAGKFEGSTTEAYVRQAYLQTGKMLDRITAPRLLYCGPYTSHIKLDIELQPLELYLLSVGTQPAAIYSEDGLPATFRYSGSRQVNVTGRTDEGSQAVDLTVESKCDAAEVAAILPSGKGFKSAQVDGKPAEARLVRVGDALLPVVPVGKGKHQVRVIWGSVRADAAATPEPGVAEAKIPEEALGLTSDKPDMIPGVNEIKAMSRKLDGVTFLQSAAETTANPDYGIQPDLNGLMARADADSLSLTAGTTRKVQHYMGAAFAGFETQGMKQVKLQLDNTFHNAYSARGKIHVPMYKKSSRSFAGIMLSYHAPGGYTTKVALGLGVLAADCSTPYPAYAGKRAPDRVINVGDIVDEGPTKVIALDLTRYAPKDWDGRLWFSVGSDWVASERRLTAKILAVNEKAGDQFVGGVDPAEIQKLYFQPRQVIVPSESIVPMIDGVADEEIWWAAAPIDQFFLLGGKGRPSVSTRAILYHDADNLYIQIQCQENQRKKPIVGRGSIWNDDEIELWISPAHDGKSYKQIIINAAGEKLEMGQDGPAKIGARTAAQFQNGRWVVEAAIPFKGLGVATPKPGDTWGFNICRHRPGGGDVAAELITWAPLEKGFNEPKNFSTLKFAP